MTVRENFQQRAKEYYGEGYNKYFKDEKFKGIIRTWNEFNRLAEEIWQKDGTIEFIGADKSDSGKMMSIYQIIHKDGKRGKIICVDNDVVFNFQQSGDAVLIRRKLDEREKNKIKGYGGNW